MISRAEIKAVLENYYHEFLFAKNILILENKELDPKKIVQKLGGTIKIGIIFKELSLTKEINIEEGITKVIVPSELFVSSAKRINFGFSLYELDSNISKALFKKIQKMGIELKKELKNNGHSARFVTSREKTLSSVIVGENKLIERGADICLFFSQTKIYLGKTLAIQEYKEFIRRDYQRPRRDAKSGMLPPKLARIMVNLSQFKLDEVLLDPFCGSGTILQEALLLGIKKVIGSDISPKAIQDTKSNLHWLASRIQPLASSIQLIQSDIRNLPHKLKEEIDVIITEPLLGPPLKGNESMEKLRSISLELSKLYKESFQVFSQILKKGGRIVIVFPLFKKDSQEISLTIIPEIEKMGFQVQKNLSDIKRGGLIYSRPDQRVMRELFILKKS